jgi:hypothetical protein
MKHFSIILSLALSLLTACGGDTPPEPPKIRTAIVVEMRGDSITRQTHQYLEQDLAVGSTVINMGLDGARAYDVWSGRYGSMPSSPSHDVTYTFSFGANECLGGYGPAFLEENMERIILQMKGYKTVIEAPWYLLYGGAHNCTLNIDNYRLAVEGLYKKYGGQAGFKVSMPVIDMRTDNIGEGIHLGEEHSRYRTSLLADAIYKLN